MRQTFVSARIVVFSLLLAMVGGLSAFAQSGTPSVSPNSPTAPPEGRIDVGGGRAIYLSCAGDDGPTVVLDSGVGSDSSVWGKVQPAVATFARVCRYDRAGLGQSDSAPPGVRTAQDVVADLHALLGGARLCPCVLVGHSLGGSFARMYAGLYPGDVVGLVLVDATPPTFFDRMGAIVAAYTPEVMLPTAEATATPTAQAGTPEPPRENMDIGASLAQVGAAPMPPALPIIVLSAPDHTPGPPPEWSDSLTNEVEQAWQDLQVEQARQLGGRLVVAWESVHDIHEEKPGIVIDAIHEVVEAVYQPDTWAKPAA